jgi:hypothetical protein
MCDLIGGWGVELVVLDRQSLECGDRARRLRGKQELRARRCIGSSPGFENSAKVWPSIAHSPVPLHVSCVCVCV